MQDYAARLIQNCIYIYQLGTRSEKHSFQKDCKIAVFERSPKEGRIMTVTTRRRILVV